MPAAEAQHLRDLVRLRRVRDRIDPDYTEPLDVEALARGVNMSAGHLSRQFRLADGESPYSYPMTRPHRARHGAAASCHLSVTDVCFEGAEVMQEPIDQSYSVRDCAFRDPAGNHLRIQELKTR